MAREMAQLAASYPCPRAVARVPESTVILVDDGLATGLTMQAAVAYAQRHGATATVVAVPCASDRAVYEVGSLLCRANDRLVCPLVDPRFRSVADYYCDFHEVLDEDVNRVLECAVVGGRP